MRRVLITALLLMGALSLQVTAEVHVHEGAKIQFQLPDAWQVKRPSPSVFETQNQDGSVMVDVAVKTPEQILRGPKDGKEKTKKLFKGKVTVDRKVDINGVEATWLEADGTLKGRPGKVVTVTLLLNRRVVQADFYLQGGYQGDNKALVEGIAHSFRSAPIRPKEGAKVFYAPAKTPEAGALRAMLFMAAADVDNLDKAINWDTVHAQMVRLGQGQGMTAQELRQDTIAQFRSGMKPTVKAADAIEGFLLIWENLKVSYQSPSRAKVQMPKEYRNLIIDVIKVDGEWLMAEFTL